MFVQPVGVEKEVVFQILSVCVCVALVIQHATRMRRIRPSSVACPALQYPSTLSHKTPPFS